MTGIRRAATAVRERRKGENRPIASQAALRRAGVPWSLRRGMIRPTIAGWLTMLTALMLWLAAFTFDARVLVAAAIAWTGVWLLSACAAGLQYMLWPAGTAASQGLVSMHGSSRNRWQQVLATVAGPRDVATSAAYIRLNPDRYAGTAPTGRGWYRRVTIVSSWHEPLGLFAVRSITRDASELVVVPEPGPVAVTRGDTASGARGGGRSAFGFAGLRAYEPGDPMRHIAWKRSASAGHLVVKRVPRSTVHAVLLVCDMASCTEDRQADAIAYEAMSRYVLLAAGLEHAGGKLIITDGHAVATGASQALRLIASIRQQDDGGMARDDPARGDPARGEDAAATVCHAAAAQHMPVSVVVITAQPTANKLIARLHTAGQTDVRVVGVSANQDYRLQRHDLDDSAEHKPEPHVRHITIGNQRHGNRRRHHHDSMRTSIPPSPLTAVTGLVVRAATVMIALELAVQWLMLLVHSERMWWPQVARVAVAVLAVVSCIPTPNRCTRRRLAATVRGIAFTVVTVIGGIIITGLRLRDTMGFLPWYPVIDQTATGGRYETVRIPVVQAWRQFGDTVVSGVRQMLVQLPPLSLTPASDAAMIAAIAVFLLVMRVILCIPALPWIGLIPIIVGATAYATILHDVPWAGVLVMAGILALACWAVHPRAASVATPALASILTVALVAGCTAPGLRLAQSVHLRFETGGTFSSATINPMIDLKRSLTSGSSATALTYQSNRARYLRMATLDDFSAGTWSFGASLSDSANLYGRDTKSPTPASKKVSQAAGQLMDLSGGDCEAAEPLATYLAYDGGTLDAHLSSDNWLGKHVANTAITVDRLSTRLLPAAGLPLEYSGMSGDWHIDASCSIYSRTETTKQGDTYTTSGIYLDPITSPLGFQSIETINRSVSDLRDASHLTVPDAATANAARAELVSSGAAQRSGNWLLIPIISTDGILTAAHSGSLPGALAYAWSAYGGYTDGTATPGTAFTYTISTSFANAIGYNPDKDTMALASSSDWSTQILVMPATVGAVDASDAQAVQQALATAGIAVSAVTSVVLDGSLVDGTDPFTRVDALDRAVLARYRALPSKLPGSVNAVVAQAKAAGVPSAGSSFTRQEQALQYLVRYFSSNGFTYSLDVPGSADGDDSDLAMVGAFLTRKSGYCAHYASAFAVLARALGVPTRMVLGYSTSGVVDENGSYHVSAKQLHAWDEAYMSGVGWVPFDVTPAANRQSADAPQGLAAATPQSNPSASSAPSASSSASSSSSTPRRGTSGASDTPAGSPAWTERSGVSRACKWLAAMMTVTAIGVVACLPMGVRAGRRRRRWRALERAAEDGNGSDGADMRRAAWLGAWHELQDTAWDDGARWPDTATDRDIAAIVNRALACDIAVHVADQASTAVFGAADVPAPTPQDAAAVHAATAGHRHILPWSLFRRR